VTIERRRRNAGKGKCSLCLGEGDVTHTVLSIVWKQENGIFKW